VGKVSLGLELINRRKDFYLVFAAAVIPPFRAFQNLLLHITTKDLINLEGNIFRFFILKRNKF
jgi:hypothetical protein